jgi:hypothetical protein
VILNAILCYVGQSIPITMCLHTDTHIVDGYGHYSASALGGVVFVRNIVSSPSPHARMGDCADPVMQIGAIFPLCEFL